MGPIDDQWRWREIAVSADNGSAEQLTRSVLDLADRVIEVWDARGLSTTTWTFLQDYAGERLAAEHSVDESAAPRHLAGRSAPAPTRPATSQRSRSTGTARGILPR